MRTAAERCLTRFFRYLEGRVAQSGCLLRRAVLIAQLDESVKAQRCQALTTLRARAGFVGKEGPGAWAPTRVTAPASFFVRTPAEFVGC